MLEESKLQFIVGMDRDIEGRGAESAGLFCYHCSKSIAKVHLISSMFNGSILFGHRS